MNSCFAMCFISSSKAGKSYCNATQGPAWIHQGIGTRPNDAKLEHARVTKIVCIVNWIKIQLIYSKYIHGSKKETMSRIMRWWHYMLYQTFVDIKHARSTQTFKFIGTVNLTPCFSNSNKFKVNWTFKSMACYLLWNIHVLVMNATKRSSSIS